MKWVRFAAAGLSLAAAGLLVSCSAAPARSHATGTHTRTSVTGRPWWYHSGGVSPCATPALVRAAGQVMGAGTCMGLLAVPARKLTLAVGQRIDVHMTGAGPSENRKTSGYMLPHSTRPAVLAPGAVGPDGKTQTYLAASPGHAVLVSGTPGCLLIGRHPELREVLRSCPVVAVTVVP